MISIRVLACWIFILAGLHANAFADTQVPQQVPNRGQATSQTFALPITNRTEVAEEYFKYQLRGRLSEYPIPFPDGAKGVTFGEPHPARVVSNLPVFKSNLEQFRHQTYCYAAAIVRARLIGSISELSAGKRAIFTHSLFQISDLIRPAEGWTKGDRIVVTRLGGDVVDGGERLRMQPAGNFVPYRVNEDYVLILLQDVRSARGDYLSYSKTIEVKDENIYPSHDDLESFKPGTPYAEFFADLNRIGNLVSCDIYKEHPKK